MALADKLLQGAEAQSANGKALNRLIRHEIALRRWTNGETRKLLGILERDVLPDIEAEIRRRMANIAASGPTASTLTNRRLVYLKRTIDEIVQVGMFKLKDTMQEDLIQIAGTEAEFNRRLLQSVTPVPDFQFFEPSKATLRQIVTHNTMEGKKIKDWFGQLGTKTRGDINRQLNIGLVRGDSIERMVQRIRGTRAARFRDGVFQATRRSTEAIVRTAVTHVSNQTRQATFEENSDLVKGYRWISTLDQRTSAICQKLDGKIFKTGEGPIPPAHINCRSSTVPVLKSWRELGIDRDEISPGQRESMNGLVPADTTYPEWLKGQSADVQNEVLGTTRGQLFRQGGLSFDDMVNDRGRLLTLKELGVVDGKILES